MPLDNVIKLGAVIISIIAMVTFCAALVLVFTSNDTFNKGIMIGAVVTIATTTVSYWLGTSMSSARKTELLAASTPQVPVVEAIIPSTAARPPGSL